MRRRLFVKCVCLSAIWGAFGGNASAEPQKQNPGGSLVRIDQPRDRAVFQRDANNEAEVLVACRLPAAAGNEVEVRVIDRQTEKCVVEWTALKGSTTPETFTSALKLKGGWYCLSFRAKKGGAVVAEVSVEHVGVGEVFLTCGQSNSANHGKPQQKATEDRVSVCDWTKQAWRHCDDPLPPATGKGGSPWPLLGDLLVQETGVPVAFYPTGVGATSVSQWLPTHNKQFYNRIKNALKAAGLRGVRAILWHQGESDSMTGRTAEDYARILTTVILESRKDAGFDVPWGVAIASFHPDPKVIAEKQQQIVKGQKRVIAEVPNVFEGPATDGFKEKGFLCDGVHFNDKGLKAHAEGWAEKLRPMLSR